MKVFNTFGGSFGGPFWIPNICNGHDKTFFFVAYQGNRRPGSTLQQLNVPTETMKSGNLAGLPGGASLDPTNLQPFPGNVIPASRINSVSRRLLSTYYPVRECRGGRERAGELSDLGRDAFGYRWPSHAFRSLHQHQPADLRQLQL